MNKTDANSPGTDYRPIDCDRHSELELAVPRRRRLHLTWREDNVWHDQVALPVDLVTRAGEEFLVCRLPDGATARIRLDRLTRVEPA